MTNPGMRMFVANQAGSQWLAYAFSRTNIWAACHVADRCLRVRADDGSTWLDTRPALDPRECSGASIDETTECLAYLEWAGVAQRHPQQRHLVRLRIQG